MCQRNDLALALCVIENSLVSSKDVFVSIVFCAQHKRKGGGQKQRCCGRAGPCCCGSNDSRHHKPAAVERVSTPAQVSCQPDREV